MQDMITLNLVLMLRKKRYLKNLKKAAEMAESAAVLPEDLSGFDEDHQLELKVIKDLRHLSILLEK